MEKYTILANGEKIVREDLTDAFALAGTVDDRVRAGLKQIPIEQTNRLGYVEPWHDGPIIVPNGASGTVKVMPFTMYKSPAGAGSGAGTVDAVAGGEDQHTGLSSAWYPGNATGIAVTTPLPSAGQFRWDLLYAIYTEADSDADARLVKDQTTKITNPQTINTRHGPNVSLAWELGTAVATSTDPFTVVGDYPALPTPGAGQAFVPLAYVLVKNSGSPLTVTYGADAVLNDPWLAPQNPNTGAQVVHTSVVGIISSGADFAQPDPYGPLFLSSADGGWNGASAHRPPAILEPSVGGIKMWIDVHSVSTVVASSWNILPVPIATPDVAQTMFKRCHYNWLNRRFRGELWWAGDATMKWAQDQSASASNAQWPTSMPHAAASPIERRGIGQSIRENADFNTESSTTGYRVACMFRTLSASGDDVALLVKTSTGALHLAWRQATAGLIGGRMGMILLDASPQVFPFGF